MAVKSAYRVGKIRIDNAQATDFDVQVKTALGKHALNAVQRKRLMFPNRYQYSAIQR